MACGLALAAALLGAQVRPTLSGGADVALVRLHSQIGVSPGLLSGPALAVDGRLSIGRVVLGIDYLGGRLTAATAGLPARDVVDARVFLGATPWPWLALSLGPQVRAFVTDLGTERWVFWQARARVEQPLAGPRLGTYLELWRAFSSTVNVAAPLGRAQGGEAGLVFQPPRGPWSVRLWYRVDDATLSSGGSETLETLGLGLALGGR
jgi:hypothetical protein